MGSALGKNPMLWPQKGRPNPHGLNLGEEPRLISSTTFWILLSLHL